MKFGPTFLILFFIAGFVTPTEYVALVFLLLLFVYALTKDVVDDD